MDIYYIYWTFPTQKHEDMLPLLGLVQFSQKFEFEQVLAALYCM